MMTITPREKAAIIQSLAAGVVPKIGLEHIQVGRKDEVAAIIENLRLVQTGASAIRFIVGPLGSGKTFFITLMRTVALKLGFVTLQADITTEHRLCGSGGEARSLYSQLMQSLATESRQEGGALKNLIERWISEKDFEVKKNGGNEEGVKSKLAKDLKPLQELVSGFDFATVLTRYYEGFLNQNDILQENALHWLRAEYTTKTQARQDLGVRTIIDDSAFYDYLKLFAGFVRIAGYKGLLVNIDELVVLSHRLANSTARNNNYEAILRILNDCLQGQAQGLCFLFAGTNECVEDRRRGLYSYEALATRLAPNRFATGGRRDFSSPIIQLASLTAEDCYVLLCNIRNVFAGYDPAKYMVPDDCIVEYLTNCQARMGAAYFQTTRDTVKDFVGLIQVLAQNPTTDWRKLLATPKGQAAQPPQANPPAPGTPPRDNLTEFKL